jgi:hypothetical protein
LKHRSRHSSLISNDGSSCNPRSKTRLRS